MSLVSGTSRATPENFDFNRLADWSLYYFQDHLEVRSPEFHGEVYDLIQGGHKRTAVMAFRGSAKSSCGRCYMLETVVEGARVAKRIGLYKPNIRKVMYISSSKEVAEESLEWVKEQLEYNDAILEDYPGFQQVVWNQAKIILRRPDGTYVEIRVAGKGAKIRGYRPDILILDDLEDDEQVESADQREKDLNWLNRAVINTLKPWQQLIVIGSNLHPQSLMWNVMHRKGWNTLDIQLLDAQNNSRWPEYWTQDRIMERIDDIGWPAFKAEFMNRPEPRGRTIFSRDWFKPYDPESAVFQEDKKKGLRNVIAIDPAISKKETADYTAVVTLGTNFETPAKHYLRKDGVIRGHWPINKQVTELVRLYDKFQAAAILIETVAYQEALAQEVRRFCEENRRHIQILEIKPDKDKERRAHAVAPTVERGQVFYDPEDLGHVRLLDEAVLFPTGDRDDQVDAFVYALQEQINWSKRKGRSQIKSAIGDSW